MKGVISKEMCEPFTIENLGPIQKITIHLRKANVLIGQNATAKCTVAKVLSAGRYFSYIAYHNSIAFSEASSSFFQGLISWGNGDFIGENTCIAYPCGDDLSKLEKKNNTTPVRWHEKGKVTHAIENGRIWNITIKEKSTKFNNLLNEVKKWASGTIAQLNDPGFNGILPPSFSQNDATSLLDHSLYLPADTGWPSIFSLGKNSIRNIADWSFHQFAKSDVETRNFRNDTSIEPFDITFKNIDGRGYIKKNNGKQYYRLNNRASGYKSAIAIILSLKYNTEVTKKSDPFLIEEPEWNPFPSAQNKLIQFLPDKTDIYGNSISLTTRIPYTIPSLNNLIYAYEEVKKQPKEAAKIIEKKIWINPAGLSAYRLFNNGTCDDRADREEGFIKAEKIDAGTSILKEQFSSLLNLQLSENEFDTN